MLGRASARAASAVASANARSFHGTASSSLQYIGIPQRPGDGAVRTVTVLPGVG
jgi:hypothetical protein